MLLTVKNVVYTVMQLLFYHWKTIHDIFIINDFYNIKFSISGCYLTLSKWVDNSLNFLLFLFTTQQNTPNREIARHKHANTATLVIRTTPLNPNFDDAASCVIHFHHTVISINSACPSHPPPLTLFPEMLGLRAIDVTLTSISTEKASDELTRWWGIKFGGLESLLTVKIPN